MFEDDGWVDLAVANDSCAAVFVRNKHDGTFRTSVTFRDCADDEGREHASLALELETNRDGKVDSTSLTVGRYTGVSETKVRGALSGRELCGRIANPVIHPRLGNRLCGHTTTSCSTFSSRTGTFSPASTTNWGTTWAAAGATVRNVKDSKFEEVRARRARDSRT